MPIIVFIFILLVSPIYALYNGNPSDPELPEEGHLISKESWLAFKIGYEGDFVFNRKLEYTHSSHAHKKNVSNFEINSQLGTLAFTFNDRVDVYGVLGASQFTSSSHPKDHKHLKYKTHEHLSFGGGLKAIAFYWGNTELGIDAKYFDCRAPLESAEVNGSSVSHHSTLHYQEWQVGVAVSHRIRFFVPYLGLAYANVLTRGKSVDHLVHLNMQSSSNVGAFVGCGLSPFKTFAMNVEVRMFDENALFVSGVLRF